MRYLLLLVAVLMGGGTIASGQIALSGTVMTDSGEPAAFANVILTPVADTTRVLDAGLVDMTGHYALKKQRQGRYLVTISLVGYRTLREEVLLRTASVGAGTDVVRDFVLTADVEQIEGVVCEAAMSFSCSIGRSIRFRAKTASGPIPPSI